jgi:hypothetical protein
MTWSWKLATDTDDSLDFLNGTDSYSRPVSEARIGATQTGFARLFCYVMVAGGS